MDGFELMEMYDLVSHCQTAAFATSRIEDFAQDETYTSISLSFNLFLLKNSRCDTV